jgi:hypothetical protein
MALPKKGFRKITVDGNQFLWRVRKKISPNERHNCSLGIPIQHIDGGAIFIAYIGYNRSGYQENNEFAITPLLIKKCITKAINAGWKYMEKGNPFELDCKELRQDNNV